MTVNENNVEDGIKVVRGKDWRWGDQDRDSVFGIVTIESDSTPGWVRVTWVNSELIPQRSNSYRIGAEGKYDLYMYKEEY